MIINVKLKKKCVILFFTTVMILLAFSLNNVRAVEYDNSDEEYPLTIQKLNDFLNNRYRFNIYNNAGIDITEEFYARNYEFYMIKDTESILKDYL